MGRDIETKEERKQDTLRLALLEQLQTLVITAFSLVAALAWNDAIQSLFKAIFGEAGSLYAKFFYAILITVIVVCISRQLTRMIQRLHKRLNS